MSYLLARPSDSHTTQVLKISQQKDFRLFFRPHLDLLTSSQYNCTQIAHWYRNRKVHCLQHLRNEDMPDWYDQSETECTRRLRIQYIR